MRFESPYYLLLLLVLPLVYWYLHRRSRFGYVRHSSIASIKAITPSLRVRMKSLPVIIRMLALALLIVAIARPQKGSERIDDFSKGVAIEMAVDRSSSMGAEMDFDGKSLSRLKVVKKVFREFVHGNGGELKGRLNDLIGMIAFARYADTICPLTLGHNGLLQLEKQVKLVQQRSEDGTSIGDAIALAAARLKNVEKSLRDRGVKIDKKYEIKSKIIILLTDGVNNYGKYTPLEAAKLAKKWGVKIYCIGIGNDGGDGAGGLFGFFANSSRSIDTGLLEKISSLTGGKFYMAGDSDSLRNVYKEIDNLEKSEVKSVRYLDYKERFVILAIFALGLLLIEVVLQTTIFRRMA